MNHIRKILTWLKRITLLGNCFLCNDIIKIWNRSGYVLEKRGEKDLYRVLLCKTHYNGYYDFPAVRSILSETLLQEINLNDSELFKSLNLSQLAVDQGITPPEFRPSAENDQSRLDVKEPIKCPNCQYEFTP